MRAAPFGWALAIVTALFAIVSAIVYLATGQFTIGWLYASAIVYGCVAISAIALLLADRSERGEVPPARPNDEPLLAERKLIYRTRVGSVWRLEYAYPDGRTEIRHVAAAAGQMLTHHEIAMYIDALPRSPGTKLVDAEIEAALASHAIEPEEAETVEEEVPR